MGVGSGLEHNFFYLPGHCFFMTPQSFTMNYAQEMERHKGEITKDSFLGETSETTR